MSPNRIGASVFIDEAHSILACGRHGRGAAEKFGVEDRVPLTYGTFSKAFGALGGFVAGPRETLQYLRFYAHPYVYSCALPPVVVAAILKALEIGASQPQLRRRLWENADYFRDPTQSLGIDTGNSTTYVMPIVIGRPRTHVSPWPRTAAPRVLGRAGRLSGGPARPDLLPRLCHRETYPGRPRRSAQHSGGHAGSRANSARLTQSCVAPGSFD